MLPPPITTTDEYLAAVLGRLDTLAERVALVAAGLAALADQMQPAPESADDQVVELREPEPTPEPTRHRRTRSKKA